MLAQGAGELKMRARSTLTLTLFILALAFSVDLPLLMSVAQAADITPPGLHRKAFTANENSSTNIGRPFRSSATSFLRAKLRKEMRHRLNKSFRRSPAKGRFFYVFPVSTQHRRRPARGSEDRAVRDEHAEPVDRDNN